MNNLNYVKKGFGFITKTSLLILLVLITCTCSGPRLMLGSQSFEKQIDYSIFSGKLAKQIEDPMGCAILKTEDLGFHLWHQEKLLIWQPYQVMLGTGFYPSLELTQKRCSLIKWYPYRLITHSFLNRYKTVWIGPKPNWHIVYPPVNLPVKKYSRVKGPRSSQDWTQRSTGRTQVTTPTTVRSSRSSYTTNRENGNGRTTSLTIGELRKRR